MIRIRTPRWLLLIVVLLAGAPSLPAQDLETRLQQAVTAAVDADPATSEDAFPGVAVHVAVGGQGVWTLAGGVSDVYAATPTQPTDGFRIGSLTKSFTAGLILRLVDTGLLELDGSVDTYLPELLPRGDEITVRHLLTHTSGLKDHVNDMPAAKTYQEIVHDPSRTWAPETLVADAVAMGLAFAPGEGFHYSNTGYTVLALLAETVTGTSFGDAMQTHVLGPLDLSSTAMDLGPGHAGLVPGYVYEDSTWLDTSTFHRSFEFGAGGMISTVSDVAHWIQAFVGNDFLSAGLRAELLFLGASARCRYSFGINYCPPGASPPQPWLGGFIWHGGLEFGFGASMFYHPERDVTVVALDNGSVQPFKLVEVILAVIDELPTAAEPAAGIPSASALDGNHPNPFNTSTTIAFELAAPQEVTLRVFDVLGRNVSTLLDARAMPAGHHGVPFDARGLPGGTYVYQLIAGDQTYTQMMVLAR